MLTDAYTWDNTTGVQLLCAASYEIWSSVGSCMGRATWPGQASMIFAGPAGCGPETCRLVSDNFADNFPWPGPSPGLQ